MYCKHNCGCKIDIKTNEEIPRHGFEARGPCFENRVDENLYLIDINDNDFIIMAQLEEGKKAQKCLSNIRSYVEPLTDHKNHGMECLANTVLNMTEVK